MNKQFILPLVVIGLCSSMIFGCSVETPSKDIPIADIVEGDSTGENHDSVAAQEVGKLVLYAKINTKPCFLTLTWWAVCCTFVA